MRKIFELFYAPAGEGTAGGEESEGQVLATAESAEQAEEQGEGSEAEGGEGEAGEAAGEADAQPRRQQGQFAQRRISSLLERQRQQAQALQEERARRVALEEAIVRARGEENSEADQAALIESRAQERAQQLTQERAYVDTCNAIYRDGVAKHGQEFQLGIQALNTNLGEIPPSVVRAAQRSGVASDVLMHLSGDLDQAFEIFSLPPEEQGYAIAEIAGKLKAPPPPKPKASAAPPPVTPKVGGATAKTSQRLDDDNLTTEQWMALRNKQLQEKRAQR